MNIGAIILAAGTSTGTGECKPLTELGGRSLIDWSGRLFSQAGIQQILVVSGHWAQEVEEEASQLGLRSIHNPDYSSGLFSSICVGVRHLSDIQGFFVLPAAIPLVRPATLRTLLTSFDGQAVFYPCFDGVRGHPPLIPADLISAILQHDGRNGLSGLLEKKRGKDIPVWDQGILLDAESTENFAELQRRLLRYDTGEPAEALELAARVMSPRARGHGLAVARAAGVLGRELNAHGSNLDLCLLHNAALLHDIAKGLPQHEKMGADMLRDLGLGRLAPLVVAHRDTLPPSSGRITETEVLFLADKLIRGSRLIRLEERFHEKINECGENVKTGRIVRFRHKNALAIQSMIARIIGQDVVKFLQKNGHP